MIRQVIIILTVVCLLYLGCSKDSGPNEPADKPETSEKNDNYQKMTEHTAKAVDAAGDYLAQKKEKTINYIRTETAKLQEKMNGLKEQAEKKGSDVKQKFDQYKQKLDQQLSVMGDKLNQAKELSAEKWSDFQQWLQANMDKAAKIYNDAESAVQEEK